MILMTERIGQGPVRRCDARCYAANPGGLCDCICGGMNHAAGIGRALSNVREIFLGPRCGFKWKDEQQRDRECVLNQEHVGQHLPGGRPTVTRAAERALRRIDDMSTARQSA